MASLLLRRIQSVQRRLLSSLSLKNSINGDLIIPPRYFCKKPGTYKYIETDIRNMPGGLKYFLNNAAVRRTENKETSIKRPKRYFVQLYSVQLLTPRGDMDQIYGSISIDTDLAFKREFGQESRHDIDRRGYFRLNGPNYPLWAIDYNLVYPKLYRGDHPDDFYHPSRGIFPYDDDNIPTLDKPGLDGIYISLPDSKKRYRLDKFLVKTARTTCGLLRLAYASVSDAADSYVSVKLLEWNGQGDSCNIYGKIFAANSGINDIRAKSLVFDRNRAEENLSILPGQYIPLHRPCNIVSMGHSLVLTLEIFYKNTDSNDYSDDRRIINKTMFIEAKCCNKEESGVDGIVDRFQLGGKLAMFEVQVNWLPYWALATAD